MPNTLLNPVNCRQLQQVSPCRNSRILINEFRVASCRPGLIHHTLATHLSFGEVERLSQLLALLADHVVIVLEGVLELQQLTGRERRPDPLGLPEGLQQERREFGSCERRERRRQTRWSPLNTGRRPEGWLQPYQQRQSLEL